MAPKFSTIGQALRQARIHKKLSQDELARKLGFTQTTISRAESGRDLKLATLVEIARALDLEPLLAPRGLVPAIRAIVSDNTSRRTTDAIYTSDNDDDFYDEGTASVALPIYELLDTDQIRRARAHDDARQQRHEQQERSER